MIAHFIYFFNILFLVLFVCLLLLLIFFCFVFCFLFFCFFCFVFCCSFFNLNVYNRVQRQGFTLLPFSNFHFFIVLAERKPLENGHKRSNECLFAKMILGGRWRSWKKRPMRTEPKS